MSRKTRVRLLRLAYTLEKIAYELVGVVGIVVLDAASPKRVRRTRKYKF